MKHEKFTTAELEQKAAVIMESFNFEAVQKHMVETNWKWYMSGEMNTPNVEGLRVQARALLTRAIWEETPVTNVGTGGFMAYKLPWGLELSFRLISGHS
jgi:hypothetical protein